MIYAIGDVHGCYTQFTELRERIEKTDPEARFILIGDLVHRGPEEKEMLAWAYENITLDGKYQMILGNHDDVFIEQYAKEEFETVFRLARDTGRYLTANYKSRLSQEEGHKYAVFLAKQPLIKELETSGRKYLLAHAWMRHDGWKKKDEQDDGSAQPTSLDEAFYRRMCLLWDRDCDDYSGEINDWYKPKNGEILIHGHSVTTRKKEQTHRGFSPGKVWDMGSSINIDCGVGYRLSKHDSVAIKYGNLAAYNLDTGEVLYLWDIPDDYPSQNGEYIEDIKEREAMEEAAENAKKAKAQEKADKARAKALHLRTSFFSQFPGEKPEDVRFNFWDDYFCHLFNTLKNSFLDFDLKQDVPMGYNYRKERLYIHNANSGTWASIHTPLNHYRLTTIEGKLLLFGITGLSGMEASVSIHEASYGRLIMKYTANLPVCNDFRTVIDGNEKFEVFERREGGVGHFATGLATCDFFLGRSIYSVKIVKYPNDVMIAKIVDSKGNVLDELTRGLSSAWVIG
jgi:hypothetical protein